MVKENRVRNLLYTGKDYIQVDRFIRVYRFSFTAWRGCLWLSSQRFGKVCKFSWTNSARMGNDSLAFQTHWQVFDSITHVLLHWFYINTSISKSMSSTSIKYSLQRELFNPNQSFLFYCRIHATQLRLVWIRKVLEKRRRRSVYVHVGAQLHRAFVLGGCFSAGLYSITIDTQMLRIVLFFLDEKHYCIYCYYITIIFIVSCITKLSYYCYNIMVTMVTMVLLLSYYCYYCYVLCGLLNIFSVLLYSMLGRLLGAFLCFWTQQGLLFIIKMGKMWIP